LESENIKKQMLDKIKKSLYILLAAFLIGTLAAASASACSSKADTNTQKVDVASTSPINENKDVTIEGYDMTDDQKNQVSQQMMSALNGGNLGSGLNGLLGNNMLDNYLGNGLGSYSGLSGLNGWNGYGNSGNNGGLPYNNYGIM
jgi:hypothetical protein